MRLCTTPATGGNAGGPGRRLHAGPPDVDARGARGRSGRAVGPGTGGETRGGGCAGGRGTRPESGRARRIAVPAVPTAARGVAQGGGGSRGSRQTRKGAEASRLDRRRR